MVLLAIDFFISSCFTSTQNHKLSGMDNGQLYLGMATDICKNKFIFE